MGEEPKDGEENGGQTCRQSEEREFQSGWAHNLHKQLIDDADKCKGCVDVDGIADEEDCGLPVSEQILDQIHD